MANNNPQGPYDWNTQHDPNRLLNSTAKPLWNRVMQADFMSFDSIQLEDLRGENNSIMMFSTFANHVATNPPYQSPHKQTLWQ